MALKPFAIVLFACGLASGGGQNSNKPSPFPSRNPKTPAAAKPAPAPPPATVENDPPEPPSKAAPKKTVDGEVCRATFYGVRAEGTRTSSGEPIRNEELTLAHPSLPFGTEVKLVNLSNNKSIEARVNNRISAGDRCRINVTNRAARELGFIVMGSAEVSIQTAH